MFLAYNVPGAFPVEDQPSSGAAVGVTRANADEGLKKTKERKYDLEILDILMEGVTGDRIFAMLRKDSRYREVPIIMASALDEKTYRCFQALGNVSFLEKPFNKEKLLGEIAKRL